MQVFNTNSKRCMQNLVFSLCNSYFKNDQMPVFVCLGTDKIVGDSLGAITGELLTKKYKISCYVYGNLTNNITQKNIDEYFKIIKQKHPHSPIYVIDASLSDITEVGLVKFKKGAVYTNGTLNTNNSTDNQQNYYYGDYNITAVVNTLGVNSLLFLKSVSLQTVLNSANFIAKSIYYSLKLYSYLQKSNIKACCNY